MKIRLLALVLSLALAPFGVALAQAPAVQDGPVFLHLNPYQDAFSIAVGNSGGIDYTAVMTITPGVEFVGTPWCNGVEPCVYNVGTLQSGSTAFYYPSRLPGYEGLVTVTVQYNGGGQVKLLSESFTVHNPIVPPSPVFTATLSVYPTGTPNVWWLDFEASSDQAVWLWGQPFTSNCPLAGLSGGFTTAVGDSFKNISSFSVPASTFGQCTISGLAKVGWTNQTVEYSTTVRFGHNTFLPVILAP